MNSKISVYVPAYNAEKTIEICINSILKQTIMPDKILIVNDCSTDKTVKILNTFGNKIQVIHNKNNLGLSHSMNIAKDHLKTRYIAKIDADVELTKNWIEILLKKIEQENVTLIGGKMYEKFIKNPFNHWRSLRLKQNWGEEDISNPKFIFGCNNILNTSKFFSSK